MTLHYDVFKTKLGWMAVIVSSKGIRRTTLPQPTPEDCLTALGNDVRDAMLIDTPLSELRKKLDDYFQGKPVAFDQPLDYADARPFSKAAWEACRSIPDGETRSYAWLAAQAGRPGAPRAAGQAMARNPLPILVPCHRVVASDGSLCGFGSGKNALALKQQLLDLDRKRAKAA